MLKKNVRFVTMTCDGGVEDVFLDLLQYKKILGD